jgi:zinc transport system permease protein
MWNAIFTYQFLQNAILAGILASIVCGLIGVIVIEKKLVMMSGGIAHTAYGGVGFGYLCNIEPIIGAFIFSILAAFGIGAIKRKGGGNSDVIIGLFWSLGMALGIVFIALMPGYPPDMNSYLFGNILSVTRGDLKLMILLTLIVVTVIILFFHNWKVYLFDEEFAKVIGVKIRLLEYILLILIAMSVVILIRVTGIIMVIALLTAPAAIASFFTNKLKNRMILASVIGIICCLLGLAISYQLDIASGACIVILAVSVYFITFFSSKIAMKKRKK